MKRSKYINTENLHITYLFGAGASYNSVPIWNRQGETMILVGEKIEYLVKNTDLQSSQVHNSLYYNEIIIELGRKLVDYGNKALEFGTLDIYAKSLFLLDNDTELNSLKYHLSIYFDLWEEFLFNEYFIDFDNKTQYSKLDKRYYSLLSVILEKGKTNPELNKSISFISWNYDLQLENAYKSFMNNSENNSLNDVNNYFKFFDSNNETNDIIHLNGFRGFFNFDGKQYQNVDNNLTDILDYLLGIIDNKKQFKPNRAIDYGNKIKYAWENNTEILESAKKILQKTNILIVIGYSFPSYNRKIDSYLIESLARDSTNKDIKQIICQNPHVNIELLKNICGDNIDVEAVLDTKQFYIPHEFLFPQKAQEIFF